MKPVIEDLYSHMEWADAEHWNAFASFPSALDDGQIILRLFHIHLVQNAFLAIVRRETFVYRPYEEFADIHSIRQYAMDFHETVCRVISRLTEKALSETLVIPWFHDPPLRITMGEALLQAAMHSQYHRGQNATRLRELGGEPPLTDYIAWLWKGRPGPDWDRESVPENLR